MTTLAQTQSDRSVLVYATVALGGLAVALIYISVLLSYGEDILKLDLVGGFYFILLIPVALGAAGFLFGAVRSYARYKRKFLGGVIELGGPAALAALVVAGGMTFYNPPASFDLVVRFRQENGQAVKINSGNIAVVFDQVSRQASILGGLETIITDIPYTRRREKPTVSLETSRFTLVEPRQSYDIIKRKIDIIVKPIPMRENLSEGEECENGNQCLSKSCYPGPPDNRIKYCNDRRTNCAAPNSVGYFYDQTIIVDGRTYVCWQPSENAGLARWQLVQ